MNRNERRTSDVTDAGFAAKSVAPIGVAIAPGGSQVGLVVGEKAYALTPSDACELSRQLLEAAACITRSNN